MIYSTSLVSISINFKIYYKLLMHIKKISQIFFSRTLQKILQITPKNITDDSMTI